MTIREALRLALALMAPALVLAATPASAADDTAPDSGSGAVTLLDNPFGGAAAISTIDASGRAHEVWRCPHDRFCGELVSAAWAPDGRHLAASLTEVSAHNLYVGFHVIDTVSGHDSHIIGLTGDVTAKEASPRQWVGILDGLSVFRRFGCLDPRQLAWSPDGRQLAFTVWNYDAQFWRMR